MEAIKIVSFLRLGLFWLVQKPVAILLTLLYFNSRGMYVGLWEPTFISNDLVGCLQQKFCLKPISSPKEYLNPSAEISGFQPGDECGVASGGSPKDSCQNCTGYFFKVQKGAPDFSPAAPLKS